MPRSQKTEIVSGKRPRASRFVGEIHVHVTNTRTGKRHTHVYRGRCKLVRCARTNHTAFVRHGAGTLTLASGVVVKSARWRNGGPCKATLLLPGEWKYEGRVGYNLLPNGRGTLSSTKHKYAVSSHAWNGWTAMHASVTQNGCVRRVDYVSDARQPIATHAP